MRIQCILCFTIIPVKQEDGGSQVRCPNCHKHVAVPRTRFERSSVIDDFVIEEEIGAGGMATVYRARQLSMDRPVALKILADRYSKQEKFAARFLKEAKSAARLNHPNLVHPIKVGTDEDVLFYAMEYVRGVTVAQRIRKEGALDLEEALNIVQQAAEALHAAWTQEGLIHRDIKPDNIILADSGHAKIMDLGIAVTKAEAAQAEVSGTPRFMAPEQFRGRPVDCRTDIYSLGVTLYNAVVGYPPFKADTVKDLAKAHLQESLQFPEKGVLFLPQRVKRLIGRMMSKDPKARYQDYDELLQDIVFIRRRLAPADHLVPSVHTISFSKYRLTEGTGKSPSEVYRNRQARKRNVGQAQQQAPPSPLPRFRRRHGIAIAVLVALVLLLVALLYWAEQSRPSGFGLEVQRFLSMDAPGEEAGPLIRRGAALLRKLPASPSRRDRYAHLALRERLLELRQHQFLAKEQELQRRAAGVAEAQKQLATQAAEQAKTDAQLSATADGLEVGRQQLALEQQKLDERMEKLAASETALDDAVQEARRREEQLAQQQRAADERLVQIQQLRLITLCRGLRFEEALALLAGTPDRASWQEWRQERRREVEVTRDVIRLIFDSGTQLAGEVVPSGRILSIARGSVKLAEIAGDVETYSEVPLSTLSAEDLILLAGVLWKSPEPAFDDVRYSVALCWGDFGLALRLRPDAPQLGQLVRGCLERELEEIDAYLRSKQRKAAAAKASALRQRYGGTPQYQQIASALVDLFRPASTGRPALTDDSSHTEGAVPGRDGGASDTVVPDTRER